MEPQFIYELVGYTASLLVVISLMMSAVVKLRLVNMTGAITFAIYGILIGSMPVVAMNGIIVLVNIYHLVAIFRDKEFFELLEVDANSNYTQKFLEFHKEAIKADQPAYKFGKQQNLTLFVLRNMVPAGLVQGNIDDRGILTIDLDFVIPRYRDFKIGRYLFREKVDFFRKKNIHAIKTSAGSQAHNHYLEKTGFTQTSSDGPYTYELPLGSNGD